MGQGLWNSGRRMRTGTGVLGGPWAVWHPVAVCSTSCALLVWDTGVWAVWHGVWDTSVRAEHAGIIRRTYVGIAVPCLALGFKSIALLISERFLLGTGAG